MKSRTSLVVASLLALAQISSGQQAREGGAEVVAETGAVTAKLRDKAEKARAGVEAAIGKVAKAGALKISTEAYYRDVLARFKPAGGGFPVFDTLYYPPRFDTSAEMEPINLAWDELRVTMEQIEREVTSQRDRVSRALGESIEEAARTAEKPEDLATALKLQTAFLQMPEGARNPRSSFGLPPAEGLGRVLAAMNSALEALGRKDYAAMGLALQRVSGSPYGSSEARLTGLPFNVDTVWTVFRERLAAVPRTAALASERALEQALQNRKPEADCERLITEFDARMQEVERLLLDPSNRSGSPYQRSETRPQLMTAFRAVMRTNAVITGDGENANEYQSSITPVVDGPFAMSPEFRVYISNLTTQRSTAIRAARDRAEKARQQESARAQAAAQEEQAALQKKLVADVEARVKASREKLKEQLKAVTKPQELLAVADSIPSLFPQENRYTERQENWQALQMELKALAAWWADPVANAEAGQTGYDRSASAAFAAELRELREKATRQVFAERFKAPELAKPPLSELTPIAAAERLAVEAGEKGDWLRAYEILRALSSPLRYGGGEGSVSGERMAGIKAYLVGRNMEQAGQFRDAALSYRQVLTLLGEHLPIKEAGERLQALQKEHPEAVVESPKPGL